jgi:hypothetical protein
MKVLVSLHKTAVGRLERYKATTAGQQSNAKQSIPPPKHPGGNDLAVAPVEEVHQLPADVPRVQVGSHVGLQQPFQLNGWPHCPGTAQQDCCAPSTLGSSQITPVYALQGNMQGILAMLQSKADRHAAAWEHYKVTRQDAENDHNTAAAAAAASTRGKLQSISQHIEDGMAVLAEDRVMVLNEQQLQEVSANNLPARKPLLPYQTDHSLCMLAHHVPLKLHVFETHDCRYGHLWSSREAPSLPALMPWPPA